MTLLSISSNRILPRLVVLSALLALLVCVAATATASPVEERRALNRETFLRAWELIHKTYWDPEFGGLDWPGVRDELLPTAEAAAGDRELRRVIEQMLSRLGDSHFGVIPGSVSAGDATDEDVAQRVAEGNEACDRATHERLLGLLEHSSDENAELGLEVRLVEGSYRVTRVDDPGPARDAGVESGWILARIDDLDPAVIPACLGEGLDQAELAQLTLQTTSALFTGAIGSTASLVMIDVEGQETTLEVERRVPADKKIVKFGNLPPIEFRFQKSWVGSEEEGRFAVVRFSSWMLPASKEFEALALEFPDTAGVVLDLRGNPGGVGGLSMGVAGHFIAEKDSLGTLKARGQDLEFRVNPRLATLDGKRIQVFAGPVAIVVDRYSASTSEIFAAGMQDLGRARVFGETTMAAALPAVLDRLPNGDVLMHAIADYFRAGGERIEGSGVVPDVAVPVTSAGLAAGRDEPLEAALAWLASQR